jgi:transposase
MARYKEFAVGPRLIALDLSRQLLPGTFEHALDYLVDRELDLSNFDARYCNDETGAPAYRPALLLKVVLFAYSRGIIGSRPIERACREQATFMALSADSAPHFTTIAAFVSGLGEDIAKVFAQVLYICDRQGLIGREMFAIDGVKLPSNASKAKSGTRADFKRQAAKLEAAAAAMLARHRADDEREVEPDIHAKEVKRIDRYKKEAAQVREWLIEHADERRGAKGSIRKSNRTDNDSAKMATSKGVIQGYAGVAAVDAKHQIVVEAQAHGTGSEQALLVPVVEAMASYLTESSLITADAGYHSESNLEALAQKKIDALIADNGMRKRDERFANRDRHKQAPDPLYDKAASPKKQALYQPADFHSDPVAGTCLCPAGQSLYSCGTNCTTNGRKNRRFRGTIGACTACKVRARCLRYPERSRVRQVAFFVKNQGSPLKHTQRMRERIDSPDGRARYGRRFATVEPVFGNLRHNKQLNRFTLRGRTKVDAQWKLYCLVHNIEKLAHHGYGS